MKPLFFILIVCLTSCHTVKYYEKKADEWNDSAKYWDQKKDYNRMIWAEMNAVRYSEKARTKKK